MEQVARFPGAATTPDEASGVCRHCGLVARGAEHYCCYGCELAAQIAKEANEDHSQTHNALTFSALLAMAVMMLALFLYAEDVFEASAQDGMGWMRAFYRYASAVLAAPILWLCGVPLARHAVARLRSGHVSMSALILLGACAAYLLSIVQIVRGGHAVYFDTAAAALVLATLGRYLEATVRTKVAGSVREAEGGLGDYDVEHLGRIPAVRIAAGMVVRVPAESTVPVDLRLTEGPVEVNLAVLTGEAIPTTVERGAFVPSGAVGIDGAITGVALGSCADSTLAQTSQLARVLRDEPSRLLDLSDRLARWLAPAVAFLAMSTLVYWTRASGFGVGLEHALAVVLVACPCTYAVAAPLAHWLAIRRALRGGVLVKNAAALERLASVDAVAFDKTGTLTSPDLTVTCLAADGDSAARIRGLEHETRHPMGLALLRWAGSGPSEVFTERRIVAGVGVEGRDERGRLVRIRKSPSGEVVMECDGVESARFVADERLRPDAKPAVDELKAMGIEAFVVTGDAEARASRVARALDVLFVSGQSAAEKVAAIRRYGEVAMVGDGINDAPALAGATVGIAMPNGTDLSRALASVTLRTADLRLIPWVISAAQVSTRSARRLLIGATIYNALFVTMAVCGWLLPVWAGVSMLISSLTTIAYVSREGVDS